MMALTRQIRILGLAACFMIAGAFLWSRHELGYRDLESERIFPTYPQNHSETGPDKILITKKEFLQSTIQQLNNFHDDSVARKLERDIKIVCWINTHRSNLATKATAIRNTWGKKCTTLLFFSDQTNNSFPTIGFGTPEGKKYMVPRIFKAFEYVHKHHLADADWFMRSDDDAYMVMENLRYLLSTYSTQDPWYIGRPYNFATPQGFNSGGAGFVLSKRALEMLVERPPDLCETDPPKGGPDDMFLGRCMFKLGIKIGDARDKFGKTRFHPGRLEQHLTGKNLHEKPVSIDKYGGHVGEEVISQYPISFHHIKAEEMYIFDHLLHRARPYGILDGLHDINLKEDPNKNTIIKKKSKKPKAPSNDAAIPKKTDDPKKVETLTDISRNTTMVNNTQSHS